MAASFLLVSRNMQDNVQGDCENSSVNMAMEASLYFSLPQTSGD